MHSAGCAWAKERGFLSSLHVSLLSFSDLKNNQSKHTEAPERAQTPAVSSKPALSSVQP